MIGATVQNGIEHKLAEFYKDAKRPLHEILRQVGRAEAVSFARSTQPYTGGDGWESSQRVGQSKVSRDIRKVYATGGNVFDEIMHTGDEGLADAFYYFYQTGKIGGKRGAQALMEASKTRAATLKISKLDPSLHRAARNSRGRVPGKGANWKQVVPKDGQLDAYIAKKQKKVGDGKGAWAAAARQLGGVRGLPGWVTRQRGRGSAQDRSRMDSNPYVIIHSHLSYATDILPPRAEAEALKSAHDRLGLMIETAIRKAAERANAKSNL